MIRQVDAASPALTRRPANPKVPDQSAITDLIGSAHHVRTGEEAPPLPQAFLVEKPARGGTRLHFHDEDQFQVFVAGEGRVGPEHVVAPAIHFANFHTAYGPIAAGEDGLSWLTIRDVADAGAWYLPEDRGNAQKAAVRRNVSLNLPADGAEGLWAVAPPAPDGLAVWRIGLAPAQRMEAKDQPSYPSGAGGRFHVVLNGALLSGDERLGPRSLLYATAEEQVTLVAGEDGADVLILQFPQDRHHRSAALSPANRIGA